MDDVETTRLPSLRRLYARLLDRRLAHRIGPVRRIDRVAPPASRRVAALTFDDGPCAGPVRGPARSDRPLTGVILDTLKAHGARGTFNVIGTTALNYPDMRGRRGSVFWSGTHFDHYPEYGLDEFGGVANQPDLARRMADEGHELCNHGFTHVAFGPSPFPYGARRFLPGLDGVVADLRLLHALVEDVTGLTMKLGRPPHYVERTSDGRSVYDAYAVLGYLYAGASFDGGGWRPSTGDYRLDVEQMVRPMRRALSADPNALNGAIIYEKDGYNMSAESPVADGLEGHLALLKANGYEVVTVSELLAISPFADLGPGHPAFPQASALLEVGYAVAMNDNEVKPERPITPHELAGLCLPAAINASAVAGWAAGVAAPPPELAGALLWPRLASCRSLYGRRLTRRLTSASLAEVCVGFIKQTVPGEEERSKRMSLVRKRAAGDQILTRGRAIGLLAATLVGK